MVVIYALRCPLTDNIRYVGKTKNLARRMREHFIEAQKPRVKHHRAQWLRLLSQSGLYPAPEIIRVVRSGESWEALEMHYIASLKAEGCPLTNSTSGGEGMRDGDPEVRERISATHKRNSNTPERRKALSEQAKAAWDRIKADPVEYERVREQRASQFRSMWSDRERSARHLNALHTPEAKAKRYTKRDTPEKTAARAAKLQQTWSRPEVYERRVASMRTPEMRRIRSINSKAMWAKRKATA